MSRLYRYILVVMMLLASCPSAEACKPIAERIREGLHLDGVSDVTHLSTSGMNLYVEIDNDTWHRLVVSDAEVEVVAHGEVLATISLRDKVVIRRRMTQEVLLPLRFKTRSAFVLTSLLTRIMNEGGGLTLNYRIRGGTALFKRTMTKQGVAIKSLMENSILPPSLIEEVHRAVVNM
ncbi:MAG: hypothetical protein J6Q21_01390 [Alistipes sp.]|nr:hypothetical protein [Alistipes sp.]